SSLQRIPERLHPGIVSVVIARAVARAMPEGQAARSFALDLRAQPGDLRRAGVVLHLRVQADDLPATGRERVVVPEGATVLLPPVDVVALGVARPVVVPGRRRRPACELTVE